MPGSDDLKSPTRAREGGGPQHHQMRPSLPLDVLLDIAARSDPVSRSRSCRRDVRGRVADPAFRRRLRHADRFVPSLQRGHLVGKSDDLLAGEEKEGSSGADQVRLVETTCAAKNAATATVCRAFERCHCAPGGERLRLHKPVASRDGLLLVRTARHLRVCSPATGRSQTLPPEPNFQVPRPSRFQRPIKAGSDKSTPTGCGNDILPRLHTPPAASSTKGSGATTRRPPPPPEIPSDYQSIKKMPSLQKALPPELADNVLRLYRECLRRAKFIGHQKHNTELLVTMVREQFKKNMHETDPEKIQKMKDDAARGLINHILYESEKITGRKFSG